MFMFSSPPVVNDKILLAPDTVVHSNAALLGGGPWNPQLAVPAIVLASSEDNKHDPPVVDNRSIPSATELKLSYLANSKLAVPGHYSSHVNKIRAIKSKGRNRRVKRDKPVADGTTWNPTAMAMPASKNVFDDQIFTIKQDVAASTYVTTSTTVPVYAQTAVTLSGFLSQASTLTALFDQYRISLVEAWVSPAPTTNTNALYSDYVTVLDYDDQTALPSYNAGLEYESAIQTNLNIGHYRKWVPHVALAAYAGAFTSYENETAPWIDVASPTVEHYGMKLAAQVNLATTNINVKYRVHVQFRKVR